MCSAVRSSDWAEVNALLDESSTGWGLGEYRAMTQAASQVTDWEGALRLLERMEADGKPADPAKKPSLTDKLKEGADTLKKFLKF